MKSPLHILRLGQGDKEDRAIRDALSKQGIGYRMTAVETPERFVAALRDGDVDLVLAGPSQLEAQLAMAAQRLGERWPDVPLVVVCLQEQEAIAIASLDSGAADYLLQDHLGRLGHAVERALREVEIRKNRARLEAHFLEAQKMEVLGRLSSSVAHDFNNILSVVLGDAELLAAELSSSSPLRGYTDEILQAATVGATLTRQLLLFGGKRSMAAVPLDLDTTLSEAECLLRRLIDPAIELSIISGAAGGQIEADSGCIAQLLLNLVINARDAMPGGGRITISTQICPGSCGGPAASPGRDSVVLSVSDTGCGMTEEVRGRIFEAFFTTKPVGQGTGLGLATCQDIVRRFSGRMEVVSEPGRGSTFKVGFPRLLKAGQVAGSTPAPSARPRGTETLLVVEDEPSLLQLAKRVLEGQGYQVLSASDGQEGLQIAQQHKGSPIQLVVTDVVMPRMGGQVMAEWLRLEDPELKILFTSGYSDAPLAQEESLGPGMSFLAKPYSPSVLAQRVRELLDQRMTVTR
jgi:signal transduction histidine kinase/ActR/RegA family two-component response regulator